MLHEHARARAEEIDRGLESGDEEEGRRADDVAIGEDVPIDLSGRQGRQQVIGGLAPALLEQVREVAGEIARGVTHLPRVTDAARAVQPGGQGVAPRGERRAVGEGHAEDLADDGHGQRRSPVLHEVDRPGAGEGIDELAGHALGRLAPGLHDAMGERRLDELADAGVLLAVLGDDRVEEGVDLVLRQLRADEHPLKGIARFGDVR